VEDILKNSIKENNGFSSPAADGGSHNADTPQDNERR